MAEQAQNPEQQNQINIELPEDIAEGIYSNFAIIAHSNQEFIIDYVRLMPGIPKARIKARIILTPQHAKRFIRALAENVKKYEQQFGVIEDNDSIPYPMGFGPPAQA
jgi:hypothetical protein